MSTPLWKKFFDQVERSTAPALEQMTASSGFAEITRTGLRISRDVTKQTEELSRRWLHLWNLPAAGDIAKLRGQIGSLEAELRTLRRQLDDVQGEPAPAARNGASKNGTAATRTSTRKAAAKKSTTRKAGAKAGAKA